MNRPEAGRGRWRRFPETLFRKDSAWKVSAASVVFFWAFLFTGGGALAGVGETTLTARPLEPIAGDAEWGLDRRLSTRTRLSRLDDGRHRLAGDFPAERSGPTEQGLAATLPGLWHWADAVALQLDVDLHVDSGAGQVAEGVTATAFLRVGRDTLFESPLIPLEGGPQALVWPLDGSWRQAVSSASVPERLAPAGTPLVPWDLLTVREIGIRFYPADGGAVGVVLGKPRIQRAGAPRRVSIENLRGATKTLERGDLLELAFDLGFNPSADVGGGVRNPFDPEEISIELEIEDPESQRFRHPGFFFEPWHLDLVGDGAERREVARRAGPAEWRARVAPWKIGRHRWRLIVRSGKARAEARGEIEVLASDHPGTLDVDPTNPRRLALSGESPTTLPSNGGPASAGTSHRSFYPVGHNLRSPSDQRPGAYRGDALENARRAERLGTRAFGEWFQKMNVVGENFARMWLAPWWGGLEWNSAEGWGGLGFYHQANAARVDRIFQLAEKQGIYLALETLHHGAVSSHYDADWTRNPHCRAQGGTLDYATDFFRDEDAKKSHRRYLRYVIARWGASPRLAWLGLLTEAEWSEPYFRSLPMARQAAASPATNGATRMKAAFRAGDFLPEPYATDADRELLTDWLAEMAAAAREMNGHRRLVTAQFGIPAFGLEAWEKARLDVVHVNAYTHFAKRWLPERFEGTQGSVVDVLAVLADTYERQFEKPLLVGEWGGHPLGSPPEVLLAELHAGTWASAMLPLAGSTGFWWWNLLDAADAYGPFAALTRFHAGESPWSASARTESAKLDFPETKSGDRAGLVRFEKGRLDGWIYPRSSMDPGHFSSPDEAGGGAPSPSGEGRLILPAALDPGLYRFEVWNTRDGEIMSRREMEILDGAKSVTLPDHQGDIAIKLRLL